jgi:hypothetical protein
MSGLCALLGAAIIVLSHPGAGSAPPAKETKPAFPTFKSTVIDPHVGNICYALTLADVNGDGKPDIVAVSENAVYWYENPSWRKRIIIENQTERDNVCIAPFDIDGDGRIDFALGAGWTKIGTIQWLSRGKSLDEKWQVHPIAQEPWLHRMRFGDVLGTGKPQLVTSPLNKTTGSGVRLIAFEIPSHPRTDSWKPTVLDAALDKLHNHWIMDFDRGGKLDILTASLEGISLIRRTNGQAFTRTRLGAGGPAPTPGAGEVKVGKLKGGAKFIASIEPMHGHQVVAYTAPTSTSDLWTRHMLDDSLKEGHAAWAADLDGDGVDEIIVGHRVKGNSPIAGPGVYVYKAQDAAGSSWQKHVIDDGGIAVEDLVAADLNGDGRIDIVAGGRATHNIIFYENLGTPK